MLRRLLHRLHLRHSPSEAYAEVMRQNMAAMARGIEQGARETEGMDWDERVRYVLEHTSPATLAHAEMVARRSFPALYEDEETQEA
jgi:hypothetical protein